MEQLLLPDAPGFGLEIKREWFQISINNSYLIIRYFNFSLIKSYLISLINLVLTSHCLPGKVTPTNFSFIPESENEVINKYFLDFLYNLPTSGSFDIFDPVLLSIFIIFSKSSS